VIAAGAIVMAVCLPLVHFTHQPVLLPALVALASLAAALKVTLPLTMSGSTMSVSYAVNFAALLLLGPHAAMVVAVASAFFHCHVNNKEHHPPYRTLLNMAALVLTVQGAGLALFWLTDSSAATSVSTIARPLVGAATVYFLLNTGIMATAFALSTGQAVSTIWRTNFLWSGPSYFVGAATAAIAAAFVTKTGYWFAPLGFAPIYLTCRTYKVYMGRIEDEQRHVQQTSDLHLSTIEALARAIDAKDQNTQTHIRRVQMYAAGMAKAVGLSSAAIQGVKTAALLHDIGKLAVPEHILSKPGPLTQEEFQKIRIHPEVGAEIIAAVPFPYPVAPIILSHHERWDGKGYPQGLKGEEIPIGARILTIVDYFDAVTTERPYHKALSHESAIGLLKHEAGRALDTALVNVFVDILPELLAEADAEERALLDHRLERQTKRLANRFHALPFA
jgi:putative nucleotidyltransferase with HDIG domain